MTTKNSPISAQEHASTFTNKMRTFAFIIAALAFVMDLLDNTIVNVAIPTIRDSLGASYSAIQWIVAGYSLTFATLLITGGRMGDVYGYKKTFLWGVGGFTAASLLSGVSVNPAMLIVARLLQGGMAAMMVPQVMSMMQVMYKPEERGKINGIFGALGGLAASLGPVIGGLLIKWNIFSWDWRPIFLINVPVGLFALFMGARYLPGGKSSRPLKLDSFGTLLIVGSIFLLTYPLIQGREYDWPAWSFIMMIASLPMFAAFAWWQKRKERIDGSPLVLPALFKDRSFGVGLGMNMIFAMTMISFFLTFTLLLQIGLGYSAVHAALTGLPVAFGIALTMATLGEKVLPKMGRYALTIGPVIMAAGLLGTLLIVHHYSYSLHSWQVIGPLLLVGIGMGMVFGSLFAAVLNGVDTEHAGSASGLLNAMQQVGGAVGVAVVGVIFFGQLGSAAPHSFVLVEPQLQHVLSIAHVPNSNQREMIADAKACFVDQSRAQDSSVVPQSCKGLQSAKGSTDKQVYKQIQVVALRANATNFDNAFHWAMVYAVGLLAVISGFSFILPRKFRVEAYAEMG